jgi:hypothetical protein
MPEDEPTAKAFSGRVRIIRPAGQTIFTGACEDIGRCLWSAA